MKLTQQDGVVVEVGCMASSDKRMEVALSKSAIHSQGWRLHCKYQLIPAPMAGTTTSSQSGKVPFVSMWRLLYGMLFALLFQLNVCTAAVASGATRSPPLPRAGPTTLGVPAANVVHSAEQLRLRGHREVNFLSRNHAAQSSFQNDTTNSTSYTWLMTSSNSYGAIACSDNGQHVVVGNHYGHLFTSNDYGATWNQPLSDEGYYLGIAASSDGQYWAAVSRWFGIYTSSDYGQSWSLTSAAPLDWYSIASSANGQFLSAAAYDNSIYISSDYGHTWNVTSAPSAQWQTIDSSASGQYLAAVAWRNGIYTSNDFGATWVRSPSVGNTQSQWFPITISSSGQFLAALVDGAVYTSSNYGASWAVTSPLNVYWYFLVSNGHGQYVAGTLYDVYYSDDYGVTWTLSSAPHFPLDEAAFSGDGKYLFGYEGTTVYRMTPQNDFQLAEPSASPTTESVSPVSNTCPAGTFNAQPGQPISLCAICPGGTYSTEGMNSCLSCPAGTFSTAWSSACTECPAGFYCLFGASTAVMCPSGTISNAGAPSCTACPAGQYSLPGSSTCLTCSAA